MYYSESQIMATRLHSHKVNTEEINEKYFHELGPIEIKSFHAEDGALNDKSRKFLSQIRNYVQAPDEIRLKVGTQVLLIANINGNEKLFDFLEYLSNFIKSRSRPCQWL
jgi:hypothetical protein